MAHKHILWIFTLTASLNLSVSHGPLEGIRDYEVVRPIRLHSLQKRETQSSRPETMKYAMRVSGKDIEMHLEKNSELLTKDYSETYYTEDGTPVTSTPQDVDHCYYHGTIVNDSESTVSMSTCDGLRGYFRTAAQRYLIEPLSGGDDGDHAVMKYEDQSSKPMVCGVTNTSWNADYPPITSRSRSRASGPSLLQQQKYVELILVADNREYKNMKSNFVELRKRMFEVVNFVNMVYKPLNTFIALVGLEVWSDSDKISVTAPAGATLDAFTKWRNSDLANTKHHDNAHLISGIDFEGSTVGLAFIGTLCSGHSAGVVQDHNPRAIAVGATLAHEMGHNLGMNHDDSSACACSGNSCIMAGALSWDIPKSFSSCSSVNYDQFLNNRNPECLLDKPDYRNVESTPVCGNGFQEKGEQCDCGSLEECTNPCCNATSCTLTKGSECAAGACCEDCKILSSSRVCRMKHDDCDLAEYCTGKSADCPEDVFTVNGIPCDGGRGYCNNGQCPQHHDQCVKMYGPSAENARMYCYDQNTRGLYYAYCRRPSKDQYIPCQRQDVQCGKLFCKNGNDNPNYGRMVMFSDCKASFYEDYNSDLGQVDTGTKCNDGKVCSQNECVDLETAYGPKVTNCSARCKGHAVCNHKMECQCEPGWLPPGCDTKDQNFSGLSREGVIAIAVTVTLLLLAAIAGAVAVFLKKRQQSPTLPSYNTQQNTSAVSNDRNNKLIIPSQNNAMPQQPKRPKGAPPPPAASQSGAPVYDFRAARQALRPPPPRV
ncbi:zinc metalloproteinase-disintegrin-like batroxstatin-3 [Coregonus clupeaformis]|uniref:zinc metalloproteinase-disintegrin-like batroxstatin-3 n=1 Tax=Coregonus clupeaformis TaxID=59861 RepID=UPI001BDF98B4|nr:zinc metalloproteinase-disintegrin-like batroxstatin-3 [Coregonus clupeaformis]